MAQRSFRGEAGRPFGTVAALLCFVFTLALITLGRIGFKLGGVSIAAGADPAHLARMTQIWGVYLAAEIVRVNFACLLLLAVWTIAKPIGPDTTGRRLAIGAGAVAAVMIAVAGRQGIITAAHIGEGEIIAHTGFYASLLRWGVAVAGLWASLVALEARRAQSLPRWVQAIGHLLCLTALANLFFPSLLLVTGYVALVWWGALFATLYKPEDRALR